MFHRMNHASISSLHCFDSFFSQIAQRSGCLCALIIKFYFKIKHNILLALVGKFNEKLAFEFTVRKIKRNLKI